jgi:hypothetical protein
MVSSPSNGQDTIYQLKVTLADIRPPIWRRVLVPAGFTLADLHETIQAVMGWQDYHLHQFIVEDEYYGVPDPEFEGTVDMQDERLVYLGEIIPAKGFQFHYEYDFGDSWLHEVLVEEVRAPDLAGHYPVCTGGRRACPPEDVGGVPGYELFLEAIRNRRHPEHAEMLEWAGGSFDPEAFDLEAANEALRAVEGERPVVYATDVVDFVFYRDVPPFVQFYLFRPEQEALAELEAAVAAGIEPDEAAWEGSWRIGVLMLALDQEGFTAELYLEKGRVAEDEVEGLVDAVDEMLDEFPSGLDGGVLAVYWMEEIATYDFGPFEGVETD